MASNRLKRRTFPWALAGMFAVIGIIALGGAADPASPRINTQEWADWHLWGALLGIVFVAWTYLIEWNNIVANHAIIEQSRGGSGAGAAGTRPRRRRLKSRLFTCGKGRPKRLYWVIQPIQRY